MLCLHVCPCTTSMCSIHKSQKRALDPLELAVSPHVAQKEQLSHSLTPKCHFLGDTFPSAPASLSFHTEHPKGVARRNPDGAGAGSICLSYLLAMCKVYIKLCKLCWFVAHVFDPSIQEAQAGESP